MSIQYWILIFSAFGAIGGLFGILSYIKSCRKPHATLHLVNVEKMSTLFLPDKNHQYDHIFKLTFKITNTGKLRLENYRAEVECLSGVQDIMDADLLSPVALTHQAAVQKLRQQEGNVFFTRKAALRATFRPIFANILQTKDSVEFSFLCAPEPDGEHAQLQWKIIGNDCCESGNLITHLTPRTIDNDKNQQ